VAFLAEEADAGIGGWISAGDQSHAGQHQRGGIPMLMKKLGFDPAQSATIFATTVTDIVGFFSLLGWRICL